jgi:hypothetical protein
MILGTHVMSTWFCLQKPGMTHVSSHPVTLYRSARLWTSFLGCAKPLGQAIHLGVDCPGPWWTGSLMEKSAFTRMNLSDVRMIIAIMHVLVKELLCQAVNGWILVLECLLSSASGQLWLCHKWALVVMSFQARY